MTDSPSHNEAVTSSGERRYLTVLFSDLCDSKLLGGAMEAEHYAEMLASFRNTCHQVIRHHGGHIARVQGDGVLAIFGYPNTGEDDGRRATEAALDLHAAIGNLVIAGRGLTPRPLGLHSGIHAGLAFFSEGDVERGRFDLSGPIPNAAAYLSNLAERGEILVSEETLGPASHFFATSESLSVDVVGLPRPLAVYRVHGRARVNSSYEARTKRGMTPFAGRVAELGELSKRLQMTVHGERQCVVISGGPGLGKTRLIEEFINHAEAARCLTLRGYCESYLSAEPLQPFLQVLRVVFGMSPSAPLMNPQTATDRPSATPALLDPTCEEAVATAFSLVTPSAEPRRVSPGNMIAAIRRVFEILATDKPLRLVLDDWQWADSASQQVLDAIRSLDQPILVVLATRTVRAEGLPTNEPVISLELSPLSLHEARQTMERLLPGADPFVVAEVHRYGGGNPLFIEELCHSASTQGRSRPIERKPGNAAWLNALIESRAERLAPAQARIVRAAAVIGNVFPAWLLERITGHGEQDALVRALAEQDFIFQAEQPGMLRFKHGITRDVIYDTVGLRERMAVHLRIAAALAGQDNQLIQEDAYEALAYHCAAGGLTNEAADYAERAGDKAMAASALDRARAQYLAALTALDALSPMPREAQLRWCAIAQKLGMACVFDPLSLTEGASIFERGVLLARQSEDPDALARAEYWLGYIYYARGRARDAQTHCEASLELASQRGDARLVAQVRATLGQVFTSACEYDQALVLLDSAVNSKRNQSKPGSGVAVGSAYALACKGCLLGDRGQFVSADECFMQALELLGNSDHGVGSSVRGLISAVYMWQGRWQEAASVASEGVRIAEYVKSRQLLAMSRALLGYATWKLTLDPASLQDIRDATSWIEQRDGAFLTSLNYGWLVDSAITLGRKDEARRNAARLFLRARQRDRIGEAMGCRALARDAARSADFDRASHYLQLATQSAQARGSAHEQAVNELCHAEIELQRNQRSAARARLDTACAAFDALQMRWHLQQAWDLAQRL